MAARQGLEPYGETPWRKSLTGGSDDPPSGLFVAGAHTEAPGDGTAEGFLDAVARGACRPVGADGDARLLAHSIYSASFWRIREMLRLDETVPRRRSLTLLHKGFGKIGRDVPVLDKAVRGVRSMAPGLYRGGDGRGPAWEALLERELGALLASPDGINAVDSRELNRRLFTVALRLADDVINLHLQPLLDPAVHLSRKQRLQSAFAVGMVHFLQLPYFIAWSLQSRDRASQERLRRHFLAMGPSDPKIAVFADPLDETGSVSMSLRRLAATAAERGLDLGIVAFHQRPDRSPRRRPELPRQRALPPRPDIDQPLVVPPIVDVLDYLEENDFTAIHLSTAGGAGLVACWPPNCCTCRSPAPSTRRCLAAATSPGSAACSTRCSRRRGRPPATSWPAASTRVACGYCRRRTRERPSWGASAGRRRAPAGDTRRGSGTRCPGGPRRACRHAEAEARLSARGEARAGWPFRPPRPRHARALRELRPQVSRRRQAVRRYACAPRRGSRGSSRPARTSRWCPPVSPRRRSGNAPAQLEARTFGAMLGALPRRAVGLFARRGFGPAALREREHAAAFDLLALDVALVLEKLKRRVYGAGARAPHAAAALFEPLHDLVPMHRFLREHREDRGADVAAARPRPGAAAVTVGRAVGAELEARRGAARGRGPPGPP